MVRWMMALCGLLMSAVAAGAAEPLQVHVTGRLMEINGVREIPRAMFGVHAFHTDQERIREWGVEMRRFIHTTPAANPTTFARRPDQAGLAMIIDCLGDRYHPATVLTNPDYQAYFTQRGREFAEQARGHEHYVVAEFWNEPFLNWASRPGVNYDPKFYEQSEAKEGAPMRIRGRAEPLESLVWSRQVRTVDAQTGQTNPMAYLAHSHIGHRHGEGHEFEFRGRRYRNVEMWWGRDPTQHSWYSGRQNRIFYEAMLLPFAKAVKETNPKVRVIAGWDFNIDLDGWRMWQTLHRPTIDAAIQYIDGVTEHHYYIGAERVSAWYEVVVAYTVTEHGKWVKVYNTEAGGFHDPQIPGNEDIRDRDENDPLRSEARQMTYHLRDILNLLHLCPDKAGSRAKHGEPRRGMELSGDEAWLRLLKPLRGSLVEARSEDAHQLWPVASLRDGRELVVVLFNDSRSPRTVDLRVDPPAGTRLAEGTRTWVEVDVERETLRFAQAPAQPTGRFELPGKSAVRLVFPLTGEAPDAPGVIRRQFFAPGILHAVRTGQAVTLPVELPQEQLAAAESARLRLVLQGVGRGNAKLTLNGREIDLPNRNNVVDVPVPVEALQTRNELVFSAVGNQGFQVNAAGVMLDIPN